MPMEALDLGPVPERPGPKWLPEERESLRDQLYEPARRDGLIKKVEFALKELAGNQDAEVVLQNFFAIPRSGLDIVMDGYSPSRRTLSFWKRLCHRFYIREFRRYGRGDRVRRLDKVTDHEPKPPEEVQQLLYNYPENWGADGRKAVLAWVDQQWRESDYLKGFALVHLLKDNENPSEADAVDSWKRFCEPRTGWDDAIDSFDPSCPRAVSFEKWLERKLTRFTQDAAKKIRTELRKARIYASSSPRPVKTRPPGEVDCAKEMSAFLQVEGGGELFKRVLDRMRPEYRAVIVMKYIERKKTKQIATKLETTVGTVKWWVPRARDQFRRHWREETADE